jgi:hypothetical protein
MIWRITKEEEGKGLPLLFVLKIKARIYLVHAFVKEIFLISFLVLVFWVPQV